MKITCVIPARYSSSRLPGKPLLDICGKPMIWHTYHQVEKVKKLNPIIATDDERIYSVCKEYGMKCIMTSNHDTHISRVQEVARTIDSDLYVVVCGDEPMIEPEVIEAVIPKNLTKMSIDILIRELTIPTEVLDSGNIKATVSDSGRIIALSRSPIPYPYKTTMYQFKKILGIECYSKDALDYFVKTNKGTLESIEDITLLRFVENDINIQTHLVKSNSLSVDTERDLEKIRYLMKTKCVSEGL